MNCNELKQHLMPFADGELANLWFEDLVSEFAKVSDVPLCLWMRPHPIVHRRHDQHRRLGCEQACGKQIARLSAGSSRHEVRGCRRDDDQFRGPCQTYVIERVPSLDQFRVYGPTSQCFERDRADKLGGRFCEYDVDVSRRLRE